MSEPRCTLLTLKRQPTVSTAILVAVSAPAEDAGVSGEPTS